MAASYQRLSLVQKRALDLSRARDAAVRCPLCDMQVMPADLQAHAEQRCSGRPEPGPGSKWLTHPEAIARGVAKQTLSDWAKAGKVRTRGERGDRLYLERDLVIQLVQSRVGRRR